MLEINSVPPSETDREKFHNRLKSAHSRWLSRRPIIEDLINKRPLLIYGFGGKGQWLAQHLTKQGKHKFTIFDTSPVKRALAREQGYEVLDALRAPERAHYAVILSACQDQLGQRGEPWPNYIYYQEASCILDAPTLENLSGEFQQHVVEDIDALYSVIEMLAPSSRERFIAVLEFRLSLDPADLQATRRPSAAMWLDLTATFRRRSYRTLLDVGAFDGDTLETFRRAFDCRRGIAVEANTAMFERIRNIGAEYAEGVEILPMAAWSHRTNLVFRDVHAGMIQVEECAQGGLHAAALDDHVLEPIDIIKMDIEGSEARALTGCARLLKDHRPDLALAAYHKPRDLIEIPAQLMELGYDHKYEWHFGHYSDCIDDSIFYVFDIGVRDR